MQEQLSRGSYECMVCCDNIRHEAAVWSCANCFHIFHLRCIKQWARSSLGEGQDVGWRCPACQNVTYQVPNQYRCFCGKVRDPQFQPGETAHSCGEVCNRKRGGDCTHRCIILCHPGPCPPCNAVVTRTCDCGNERKSVRCGQITRFKCEKVCGKDLNCGLHKCQQVCHSGDCLPCDATVQQECYGGHKKREVVCGTEEALLISFSCGQQCHKTLGCGNHVCEEPCHPGDCGLCPLLPQQVTHCCCGQTPLGELDVPQRNGCLDPLPTCDKTCNKPLPCGPADDPHKCQQKCHEGLCGDCEGITELTCVCGANKKEFSCKELAQFTASEPFKCERRCNKKRMCGRHKCNETCCTRDVHICELTCGRPLNCKQHKCEELCHRGNCKPCLQASFEELTCRCGAEVIYPPVPCGTPPPSCHKLCTRRHNCEHPVRHTCHSDELCPPCTELVQKPCMGDHELRKNVPCHMTDISCGRQCGKALPCGQHKCQKPCHKGVCLSSGETCKQPCSKKRPDCGHPCGAPCHADSSDCPGGPCKAQMEIKCACGNRSAQTQCQAGSGLSTEIAQFQRLTVQAMASGGSGQDLDISSLTQQKKNTQRQLECDANCALRERNRRLALALEIQNPDLDAKLSGPKYSDFLKETCRKFPAFVAKVEKALADLVQNAKQSKQPSRSYAFPSMNRDQRRLVHELAEAYGCETQSYDYEPNKNVVATAHRSEEKQTTTVLVKEKEREKPDIDYFDFSQK
ncbi:hypothetical protein BaRGS_00009298 [Batillaria attramentaria]|uniref:Shuttle craft n=1 Tax=Batillaria attramentaria TaxID=370345 RepID=A0ABD0LJN5_9CAEN